MATHLDARYVCSTGSLVLGTVSVCCRVQPAFGGAQLQSVRSRHTLLDRQGEEGEACAEALGHAN